MEYCIVFSMKMGWEWTYKNNFHVLKNWFKYNLKKGLFVKLIQNM
jgi:hypothetical protein